MYNIICKLKQVVFERRRIMLIDESRDTLKKYAIGLIIANVIGCIGLFFTVLFFTKQVWIGGIIALVITCIVLALNISIFVDFYLELITE